MRRLRCMLILLCGLLLCQFAPSAYCRSAARCGTVCFDKVCVKVMVAGTPERQQRGLMYRSSLADDEGMLFVYDLPGRYSFWMKNMRFSLDIIWITDALEVGQIMRHVPPCPAVGRCSPFAPREPVQFVLEVPAGFADEHNISEGDTVTIVNSHEVH